MSHSFSIGRTLRVRLNSAIGETSAKVLAEIEDRYPTYWVKGGLVGYSHQVTVVYPE